jgi:hypothetical protein
LINQVVENKTASPVCLVEHPYVLDGYKAPGVLQEKRNVFAVVDFSGTQYKVVDVRTPFFSSCLSLINPDHPSIVTFHRMMLLSPITWTVMTLDRLLTWTRYSSDVSSVSQRMFFD